VHAAGPPDFAGVQASDGADAPDPARRRFAFAAQSFSRLRLVRVWFYWSEIEVAPDRFDFSRYDALIEDAARAGVRVLPVLIDPPWFRSSAPPGPQAGLYPPAQDAAMADFASVVVGRYGRAGAYWDGHPELPRLPVHAWQVWNEPNILPWWGPGPDAAGYARLLGAVAGGIRRCDAAAEVVAAGLPNSDAVGMHADEFVRGMLASGAHGAFDTLSLHPYGTTASNVVSQVESLRATAASFGERAPIWVTEFGWATGGPATSLTVSRAAQADLVDDTVRSLHARRNELGVRGFVYYQWADATPPPGWQSIWFHVGLVDAQRQVKPAHLRIVSAIDSMGLNPTRPDAPAAVRLPAACRLTPDRVAPPSMLSGGGTGSTAQAGGVSGESGGRGSSAVRVPAPPVLRAVKLRPSRFRAAASGPPLRTLALCGTRTRCGRAGAKLSFRASRAGTLELRFRRIRGRRATDVPGVARHRVRPGPGGLRLLGRATRKRRLEPGRYRAVVQLVGNDGRRSRQAVRAFAVRR
jgi:hypothetical protein